MGYYEYLKDILSPLRLYDLDSGVGASELMAAGSALDGAFGQVELLEREAMFSTAESFGLEAYEDILPPRPMYSAIADRRMAVAAFVQVDSRSFTTEALNNTLSGCGISAVVSESGEHYTVTVRFPGVRGVPFGFDELKKSIEEVLPCHLGVLYSCAYLTWAELESRLGSWAEFEKAANSWAGLEVWEGE